MNEMLSELRTLLAVARYGTFAAAGDRIGLTQSAVSGHMRRLEAHLGFALFTRTGRSAELNEDGRRVLARAEEVLTLADRLGAPVSETDQSGTLRIGAISSAQSTFVKRALAPFHRANPGYRVQVLPGTSMDLLDRIDSGDLDLAIMIRPDFGLPRHLRWTALAQEPFVLAVPPELDGDDWGQLAATHPFLRYNRTSFGGRQVDRLLDRIGITVRDWVELDEIPTLLSMVAEGMGVAILPDAEAYRQGMAKVRRLPLTGHEIAREIGIVSRPANQVRAARNFTDACIAASRNSA